MKILHVLTSPRAEGTPRLVLDWLSVKEHEQSVLFLNSQPADLLPLFSEVTQNIITADTFSAFYLQKCYRITSTVYSACRRYRPQLVISWNQGYSHWIVLGARLAGIKKTIVHGGCEPYFNGFRNLLYSYYVHWPLYFMGSKIICASRYIQEKFKQIPFLPSSNIHVAYNCLQVDKFRSPQPFQTRQSNIAITVANLEPVKNHISLLKAWKKVLEKIPDAQLWLVGRGSLREELENLCKQYNIEQNVIFWGERRDVPDLLWQAKVFVHPSISEGFGTVLIEALTAGLSIVASDIPAFREVLQQGKYGILVDVSDTHLFAQKIIEAFEKYELTEDGWKNNFNYVKRFSPHEMVKQYINIISISD